MTLLDRIGEQWYAFDPESADIVLLSEPVADVIRALQAGESVADEDLEAIADALGLEPVVVTSPAPSAGTQWAMTLHLNHACNLACEYCYADGRNADGDGTAKGAYGGSVTHMSPQVLEAALDRFLGDAPANSVTVGFCGGEALLSERRFLHAVDTAVNKAAERKIDIRFELTTNGTLLTDAIIACLKTYGITVAVSLDGDKATNDIQRPLAGGASSYDKVIQSLHRLKEAGIIFGVRMTAMRGREGLERNHYALSDTPAPFANFQFHMYGHDAARAMEPAEEAQLFAHYREVANRILTGDERASRLSAVREVLRGIVTKRKKRFQCGAGRWDRAVTPNGDVFPCHRFVGMSPFRLGNVLDDTFRFRGYEAFDTNEVNNRVFRANGNRNCALCYAHHVCGGGCAQIGAATTGVISEMPVFYCQETRLRVRAVVRTLVEKMRPELAC